MDVGLGDDSLREPGDAFEGLKWSNVFDGCVFWDLDERMEAGLERGNCRPCPDREGPFLTASAPTARTVCNKVTDGPHNPVSEIYSITLTFLFQLNIFLNFNYIF